MGDASRSPHGERGLKFVDDPGMCPAGYRRSPHGERGLKSHRREAPLQSGPSLPARGAWIEIIILQSVQIDDTPSLPARGAWIEIRAFSCSVQQTDNVAPRTGSVD